MLRNVSQLWEAVLSALGDSVWVSPLDWTKALRAVTSVTRGAEMVESMSIRRADRATMMASSSSSPVPVEVTLPVEPILPSSSPTTTPPWWWWRWEWL
jgi:hypothetical protein